MKQVLINYIVKTEKVHENIALIKNVFNQLHAEKPAGVKYTAYKMGENVFIHIAQFETEEAHEEFTRLESFMAFRKDMKARQIERPITNTIEEIGDFSTIN